MVAIFIKFVGRFLCFASNVSNATHNREKCTFWIFLKCACRAFLVTISAKFFLENSYCFRYTTHLAVCQRACFTNASLILHYSLWNHTSITLPSICPELNPASIEAQKRVFSHFVLLLSFSSFHSSFPVLWGYHHEVYSLTCLVFGVVDCWRVGAIEMRIPPQVFLSIHCKWGATCVLFSFSVCRGACLGGN